MVPPLSGPSGLAPTKRSAKTCAASRRNATFTVAGTTRAEGSMKLEGRVALVTGASRGVGRAIALELARRGADVILAARTVSEPIPGMPGTLAETAAEIRSLGREAHVVAADLTDPDSVERLADEARAWRDRVDVLVNNAAFLGRAAYHDLDELSLKNFVRQFTVNVT